jgi:predicted RNA binding protein YcfA (HicA-like mRNA interferase family)
MRLPRDLSGDDLVRILKRFGYEASRQTGSHIRLTTHQGGEHHVTIPRHSALRLARSPEFWGTSRRISAFPAMNWPDGCSMNKTADRSLGVLP